MTMMVFVAWVMRVIHIGAAMGAVGGPLFVRFALLPAAKGTLDEGTHGKLRAAINARWRIVVYILITLFIISGFYNFFVETRLGDKLITGRWREFGEEDRKLYHMLFGVKVLAAFGMFFLASALAGRSATFAPIRTHARVSLTVLLLLGGLVLMCATLMRYLPVHGGQ